MKILIDARMYGLEHAGIGRYLINLVSELSKLQTSFEYYILLRAKYFKELKLPKNWTKVQADFRHYTLEEQLKLPGIIKSLRPDLVHFPHLNIPFLWNGKCVVTVHDLTMQRQKRDATTLPLPVYYLKRLPFLSIARKAVMNAHAIIVPAKAVKEDIVSYYHIDPVRIKVTPEGLTELKSLGSLENILKKYKLNSPYFIYVGNAYPHKNLGLAIKAISLMNKSTDKKVFLAIGGSRSIFQERLKKEIKKYGAEDYVKLIGYVYDGDLGKLYGGSLGLVYPSRAEGYGLQGLEAMSSGTLVLASDIPVFREIYGRDAMYFDPTDAEELSGLMLKVYNLGNNKRLEIVRSSRNFIKRYSWKKMAEETLRIYKETSV